MSAAAIFTLMVHTSKGGSSRTCLPFFYFVESGPSVLIRSRVPPSRFTGACEVVRRRHSAQESDESRGDE